MPKVRFEPSGVEIDVPAGTRLMAAADQAAREIQEELFTGECCEGRLECGNCCLEIVRGMANLSPISTEEAALLNIVADGDLWRSSCAAQVHGDVVVKVPNR